jgi:hypothetical protein
MLSKFFQRFLSCKPNEVDYRLPRLWYQLKHTYYVCKVYLLQMGGWDPITLLKLMFHDSDKIWQIITFQYLDKPSHRVKSRHHLHHAILNEVSDRDVIEMICDWESGRYSKPDKPLPALKYYLDYVVHNFHIPTRLERQINNTLRRLR